MHENVQKLRKTIYLGLKGITVGSTEYVYHDKLLKVRSHHSIFAKPTPVLRDKKFMDYNHVDMKEYDPSAGDYTGDEWRIFFFDCIDGGEFSFKDNSPVHLHLQLQTFKNQILMLTNQVEKYKEKLRVHGIPDEEWREMLNNHEKAKKLSFSYGGFNQQGVTNNKEGGK